MNLFINAVSSAGMLILFDEQRNITKEYAIEIRWNESSKLTTTIDDFLKNNSLDYSQLDNIVVVHGPGSFTGVRAICLLVNTIAFSTDCRLTTMSYFDLFDSYPIAKQSSKRDMFFAPLSTAPSALPGSSLHEGAIVIMSNEDVIKYLEEHDIKILYWEAPAWWEGEIIENIEYCDIISRVTLENHTQIEPLYLKKPNIC